MPALRILAIHAGMHDSSAAAFDDYQMVAAVSEERLTRVKGSGEKRAVALDRRGAARRGLARRDVDAIATTRGWFATHDYKFPLWRELHYTFERWRGRERTHRELAV
jgi:predicted NodU family carbamoyl transferase